MVKETGGQAFPFTYDEVTTKDGDIHHNITVCAGMTLRDWFAGQALAGIAASGRDFLVDISRNAKSKGIESEAQIAGMCYLAADAMIAERNKT